MNKIGPILLALISLLIVYITFHLQRVNGARGLGAIGVDLAFGLFTLFLLAAVLWLLRPPSKKRRRVTRPF